MSAGLGPSISRKDREEARERQREEQRRAQDESTARSLASGAATQQGTAAPGYWDMLGDPGLDHPEWGDSLEAFTQGELSRAFALGNITRKEWQNMQLRTQNKFWQIRNEMKGPDTSIDDDDMRLMYGEERPELTDAMARRLRAAEEVAEIQSSLSVESRGLKSGTEIHAVARTEDGGKDDDEGGLFAGMGGYLGR